MLVICFRLIFLVIVVHEDGSCCLLVKSWDYICVIIPSLIICARLSINYFFKLPNSFVLFYFAFSSLCINLTSVTVILVIHLSIDQYKLTQRKKKTKQIEMLSISNTCQIIGSRTSKIFSQQNKDERLVSSMFLVTSSWLLHSWWSLFIG